MKVVTFESTIQKQPQKNQKQLEWSLGSLLLVLKFIWKHSYPLKDSRQLISSNFPSFSNFRQIIIIF